MWYWGRMFQCSGPEGERHGEEAKISKPGKLSFGSRKGGKQSAANIISLNERQLSLFQSGRLSQKGEKNQEGGTVSPREKPSRKAKRKGGSLGAGLANLNGRAVKMVGRPEKGKRFSQTRTAIWAGGENGAPAPVLQTS